MDLITLKQSKDSMTKVKGFIDSALTAVAEDLENKVDKAGDTVSGALKLQGGHNVFGAVGTVGKIGYIKLANIKIANTNADSPISITYTMCNTKTPTTLYIKFLADTTTDPELDSFIYNGIKIESNMPKLYKTGAGEWELYIYKNNGSGSIDVVDFLYPEYLCDRLIVTWTDEQRENIPEGAIQAQIIPTAVNPVNITGSKGTLSEIYDNSIEKTIDITPENIGALPVRRSAVGQSASADKWHKFASITPTSRMNDFVITFKVSDSREKNYCGILTARFRVEADRTLTQIFFGWEYAEKNIDTSCFVLAYKTTKDEKPPEITLWIRIVRSYQSFWFNVLSENCIETNQTGWILYNALHEENAADSIPEGYTQITSSLAEIQNPTAEGTEIKYYIGYTENDIYGVEADTENKIFTRLAGAAGKKGGEDFDGINAFGGRRRCNLTDDGTVTAYYDSKDGNNGFTATGKLEQQITVNNVVYETGTPVQVMVEQPKFYYKVVPLKLEPYTTQNGETGYHNRKSRYYISDTPKAGFKVHPAFVRNGTEVDKIYLSAFEGCIYDRSENDYILDDAQDADFEEDKLSSIANAKPCSGLSQNLTIENSRKLARNRGDNWEQMNIDTLSASQLLMLIEYASFNMQTAIGDGIVNKEGNTGNINYSENTGKTVDSGNNTGISREGSAVSYRGEENIWGNIWKFIDGIAENNPSDWNNADSSQFKNQYGNLYITNNNSSDNTDRSLYQNTKIYPCYAVGWYIGAFGYSEKYDYLFIPTEYGGNTSLPVGDAFFNYSPDWRTCAIGGRWDYTTNAGAFSLSIAASINQHMPTLSSRLLYIPIKEVSE